MPFTTFSIGFTGLGSSRLKLLSRKNSRTHNIRMEYKIIFKGRNSFFCDIIEEVIS
jgi:hypothetical protein